MKKRLHYLAWLFCAVFFGEPSNASLSPHPSLNLPPEPPAPTTTASPASPDAHSIPASAIKKDARLIAHEEIRGLARSGLLDSALHLSRKALESDSNDAFALFMIAKLSPEGRQSAEYFKKAMHAAGSAQAVSTTPEVEESYFRLGQYHYAAGKYYLAIPFFRDYLRLFPNGDWKEPAHYWMGNACVSLAQGRPDKAAYVDSAVIYFQKLIDKLSPDGYYFPLAWEGMARAKAAKGDLQGATDAAKTALEKAPEDERSPILLLSAQLLQGSDRAEEKRLLDRLLTQYPQSPEARYLRKLNAGADPSRWKAGSGGFKTVSAGQGTTTAQPSAQVPAAAQGASGNLGASNAAATQSQTAPSDSNRKGTETSELPKPKSASGETPHSTSTSASDGFTLQLGAFSQVGNAQAMMTNLVKLGFSPELAESMHGGKKIYQVRLGHFASPEEASEYAKKNLKPHQLLSQPVPAGP